MQSCIIRAAKRRTYDVTRLRQSLIERYRYVHHGTTVRQLLQNNDTADHVEITGWVKTVRKQKKVAFAAVGDGSTIDTVQAVLKPDDATKLSAGVAVQISGSWRPSMGNKQRHELQVTNVRILGGNDAEDHPIQPKYQTREFLRTVPHLRARVPGNALLLRLRSQVIASMTRYFNEQGFIQTHTPIITSSDCEGAGEVFSITTGTHQSQKGSGSVVEPFFRSSKYLTVSAQLHLEALAQAVSKVWTLSPTFRAEKSDTPRHLSEFYMLEAEMCFVEDMNEVMDIVENMLRAVSMDLTESVVSAELLRARESEAGEQQVDFRDGTTAQRLQQRWAGMMAADWPRVSYAAAMDILQKAHAEDTSSFEFVPSYTDGFQAEHERYLATTIGQSTPVFITNYPTAQKPFYMSPSASSGDPATRSDTVACFDLLVPDLCELVGGSMREHRHAELTKVMSEKGISIENLQWYTDLRKFGSVPHGGFGLGFDRLLCYLSGVDNIRDVVAFPRWYGRCDC